MRLRSGSPRLMSVRVDAATVVEVGDLVFLDTDDAKPASAFTWTTDLATTQANFADKFLGVSHSQKKATDPAGTITVDIGPDATYEFAVASATYEIGDDLGPSKDPSANKLLNQQLEGVAASTQGIARAMEYKASASTALRMSFASAYYAGCANVNAHLG